jgi:putative FmdB family regulatory protein
VPTYEYTCTECGEQVEVVQKFTDDPLTVCTACGGRLRKVFSPVGIVFKGSGFYRTDSRNGSSGDGQDKKDKKDKEPSGTKADSKSADSSSSGSGSSDSSSSKSSSSDSGSGSSGSGSSGSSSSGSSSGSGDKKGTKSSASAASS